MCASPDSRREPSLTRSVTSSQVAASRRSAAVLAEGGGVSFRSAYRAPAAGGEGEDRTHRSRAGAV